ncbi:hypothetical protein KSS87_022066, partial [Heliosperma pusillum]
MLIVRLAFKVNAVIREYVFGLVDEDHTKSVGCGLRLFGPGMDSTLLNFVMNMHSVHWLANRYVELLVMVPLSFSIFLKLHGD